VDLLSLGLGCEWVEPMVGGWEGGRGGGREGGKGVAALRIGIAARSLR